MQNARWENDQETEAAAFLPQLVSRVMQENNHLFKQLPLVNGKSNSFQLLIEAGNGGDDQNHPPGRNLILQSNNTSSERNHLLSNEETQPLSPISLMTTLDSVTSETPAFDDDAFEAAGTTSSQALSSIPRPNKNPLKLTTTNMLGNEERDTSMLPRVVHGLPNESKLECGLLDHRHLPRDHEPMSPQTARYS